VAFGDIADLSDRLYWINVQDKVGNEAKAKKVTDELNAQLDASGVSLRCRNSGSREYVLQNIAVEALNRGFSLRTGHRASVVHELLQAITPDNREMLFAFYRIKCEDCLTPPGAKPTRKGVEVCQVSVPHPDLALWTEPGMLA
jgi:hypothetical protein